MTKWEKKGAAAKRGGKYTSMEQAFHAQRGIPKPSKRDRAIGVTFTGKAVEAQQDFYRGYHYGATLSPGQRLAGPPRNRRTNPPRKITGSVLHSQSPYHVQVPEYHALSAGQFPTLDAARKYVRALQSRGLLLGRSVEISDARGAVIVSKSYNPKRNGRSYPVKGVSPKRYWEPRAGEVVYLAGRRAVIKRVGMDEGTPYVWFARPVDGTVAMSVQNLKAIARVEEEKPNPTALPVDRWVTVKARRLANGRIEIRGKA